MTDHFLKSLLQNLNANKTDNLIHLRPLSSTITYAKVWVKKIEKSKELLDFHGPYDFYLIKNEQGIYLADIVDMRTDLHWYVDEKYRGKGYLTKALKEVILYHLFQNRNEQRITIDQDAIGDVNFKASEKVALSLGFEKINTKEYLLQNENYQIENYMAGDNTTISEEKVDSLKNQIKCLGQSLSMIQTEIEMTLGMADFVEELGETISTLNSQAFELKEIWWEENNSIKTIKMSKNYDPIEENEECELAKKWLNANGEFNNLENETINLKGEPEKILYNISFKRTGSSETKTARGEDLKAITISMYREEI